MGARPIGGPDAGVPASGWTGILGSSGGGWTLSQYQEFASPQTNFVAHDGDGDSSNGSLVIAYELGNPSVTIGTSLKKVTADIRLNIQDAPGPAYNVFRGTR